MFCFKKVFALAITCALLLAAIPVAKATSFDSMTGTWSGSNEYYSMTITLNDNGFYSTIIVQGGQTYQVTGSYSVDTYYIHFWPDGGTQSSLGYWFTGDTLTLTDWNTRETMTMSRQQTTPPFVPDGPQIPEGLIGTWTGQDGDGLLFMTLDGDGMIIIAYDTPDDVTQTGTFTVTGNEFEAELIDGTTIALQFLLTGDTLIFAGEDEGETVTLTRYNEAFSTQPPAPVFTPQPSISTLPPYEPEATPSPMVLLPTQAPLNTAAPVLTGAPATMVPPAPTEAPIMQGPVGIWQGTDTAGSKKFTFTPDGRIDITYEQAGTPKRTGTYTADGSTIKAIFDNGTAEDFRYILMGDTLLLTDAQLGNPETLTRWLPPQPPSIAMDPALLGTWGGMDKNTYVEITLTGAGEITLFIPSDPTYPLTYPCAAAEGKIRFMADGETMECTYQLQGDVLQIANGDGITEYVKKTGPLSRLEQSSQNAVSTVDAALAGTWGGMDGSVYEEITLYGDGNYVKFVPEDEALCQKGTYMANGGNLAVLLPNGALQGTYALAGEELNVTWQNTEPLKLITKTGPLVRLAQSGE